MFPSELRSHRHKRSAKIAQIAGIDGRPRLTLSGLRR
jgi:hypothetical protein